jgi:pyridoxamine 5'-phosphate oxidase family protein
MGVFTELEVEYLQSQRLARLATASAGGQPDVSAVGFGLDGDSIVSGGIASTDPWRP